ncbi:hypothetical protein BDU57DRAFT_595863 [Ampelomyces quisqualis]|uniref:Uncharacterized protein n=1 Tax=Ampelomyces quisqualis TaxID=50730 RepID=A0A6A5QIM6_AMPQU|nr:hypothetical protein BDU57DRAFT_595863 [Ampelomyces quisqualis]
MRIYFLVFAAGLPAFSDARTVIQVSSDLTQNSSNVFNDNLSRLLPFDDDDAAPAGSLPTPQRRWYTEEPIPEPANDDVWTRHVRKGTRLLAEMSYSDATLAKKYSKPDNTMQSPYGDQSLKEWGYTMDDRVSWKYRNFKGLGIAKFLKRMGISDRCREEGGTWDPASITHGDPYGEKWIEEQTYKGPDGKLRRMTGARFHMAVTPEGGIMTQYLESPWVSLQIMHKANAKATELPFMRYSSDIMWAMWEHFVPERYITQIKYFITITIVNPTTLALMRRALDSVGKELTTDGVKFSMDTDEGKALLASPNGAGFAHFLNERKLQVGLKTIDFALVMQCEDEEQSPCLVFEVTKVQTPTPPPEDD